MAIGDGAPPAGRPNLARSLFQSSLLPLLLFDGDLRIDSATPSFCANFDIPVGQTDGRTLANLGDGEWDIPQLRVLLENALLDGPDIPAYETDLVRKGFSPRRLVVNAQNVACDDKLNARVLLTINDVTDARRIEQLNLALLNEKDELLRERATLLQEMQHRVANSLQIIASILMLKARKVDSEEARLHLREAHDRVLSVAAVQQHLQTATGDVEISTYLNNLCASLASSMIRQARDLTLVVNADPATLSSRTAVSLGLVVTELVINALKHAFPSDSDGRVVITYAARAHGWTLSVADDGVGRAAATTAAKGGLGTIVVEALAKQLGAKLSMADLSPGTIVALTHEDAI